MPSLRTWTYTLFLEQGGYNFHVYSFNAHTEIVFNLDHYKDSGHYRPEVNSMILNWIAEGDGRITEENQKEYFEKETEIYLNYDYNQLFR